MEFDIVIISFYLSPSTSVHLLSRLAEMNRKPNPKSRENTAWYVNVYELVISVIFTVIHEQWSSKSSASRSGVLYGEL